MVGLKIELCWVGHLVRLDIWLGGKLGWMYHLVLFTFGWVGDLVVLEDLVGLGWTFGWAGNEIRLS